MIKHTASIQTRFRTVLTAAFVWIFLCLLGVPSVINAQVSYERKSGVVVSSKSLNGLTSGMKLAEVENVLGARGNLQFATRHAEKDMQCIAYHQNSVYGKFYLLFINLNSPASL